MFDIFLKKIPSFFITDFRNKKDGMCAFKNLTIIKNIPALAGRGGFSPQ